MCYSIFKLVAGAHDFKGSAQRVKALLGFLKQLAPYAAIELILPGGTILALLLWFYQRRKAASRRTVEPDVLTAGHLSVGDFSAFHLSRV
jgi:hypothetical protein